MSCVRQSFFCLAVVTVTVVTQAQSAEPATAQISATSTNLMPPLPVGLSPVNFFRQLLMMTPPERNKALAGRTPESRARIMAKVHEYLALEPNERELRLRATELRWYLTPLLRTPQGDREARLALIPPELRELAKSRLTQWDSLSPELQQEFLANEKTLNYVAHVETPTPPSPDPQQQKVADRVSDFFKLTPAEEQRILGTLSATERAQMEKTLNSFNGLPVQQRALCVRNYTKFVGMRPAERAEFLKNAESWSKMSPEERQTWRDLVEHVPVLPPAPMPPMPPMPPQAVPPPHRTSMATN